MSRMVAENTASVCDFEKGPLCVEADLRDGARLDRQSE